MQDDALDQVNNELAALQNTLKDRLKETNDIGDVGENVFQNTLSLEKHTKSLDKTAVKTKWKWFLEYAKYIVLGVVLLLILVLILLKLFALR